MAVNECIPYYEAAYTQRLTVHVITTAFIGKRFVGPLTTFQSGPGLAATAEGGNLQASGAPAAGGEVGGVAAWDQAVGKKGAVIRGAGTIVPVTSGAAITAGAELEVDNVGRVITATSGRVVGKAHNTVGAAGSDVQVELYGVGN